MLSDLKRDVNALADPEKGKLLARFFKTGKGQYGEGDIFYGLTVPQSRKLALEYKDLPLKDIEKLLQSEVHEERLIALLILVFNFAKASLDKQKDLFNFYLAHTKYINNWDLVDLSADKIVGEHLYFVIARRDDEAISTNKRLPRSLPVARNDVLVKLAQSNNLWEKRIAIVATFAFIKNGEYEETFTIADILLKDSHDLIQKAVGWMLREVGKRVSEERLEEFLTSRYKTMPRTCLRYAIERFPEEKRKRYLRGEI